MIDLVSIGEFPELLIEPRILCWRFY